VRPALTPVKALPVNLITGFLGVGKTTAIRHLLANKPADQHWAVLVNEMGEVGIDGPLLEQDGIAVKQVAGGCMCCVSGLPSKVALNALIREQRPDRILIEPSGIANPRQILATYRSAEYQGVLDIRATICLIDPWMLTQPEFFDLETFQDQLALADVVLASKADVVEPQLLANFTEFARQLSDKRLVTSIQQGAIDPSWLDFPPLSSGERRGVSLVRNHQPLTSQQTPANTGPELDDSGIARRENNSAEAFGCGWVFDDRWLFHNDGLSALLTQLKIPRIKGIFHTSDGWYTVNRMRNHIQWEATRAPADGRSLVEMIAMESVDWDSIDRQLRQLSQG